MLVARPQRPVAVHAVEQLALPYLGGGLELPVGEAAAELPHVDADRVRQPDPIAGDHHSVAAQRPAQLVERVAQRLAGDVFRHVGPQPPGEHGARMRPGHQRQPRQQLARPRVGRQLDRPAVDRGGQSTEEAHFQR